MDAEARGLRRYLERGGLIAYPTRAVFGLGCDPGNAQALRALVRLKRRPLSKGMIVVADCEKRLHPFMAPLEAELWQRCRATWPGAYTWLVPARTRLSHLLCGGSRGGIKKVALRHDDYPAVKKLCRRVQLALVSTSANLAGKRPLKQARACRLHFGAKIRVLEGRCMMHSNPSTIADLLTGKIVRQG